MKIKIVTWNMNFSFRRMQVNSAWSYLESLQPDIALLQEANPPEELQDKTLWRQIGGTRDWGSAIIPYNNIKLVPIQSARLGDLRKIEELEDSHPGCVRVADAQLPNGISITVISIYGLIGTTGYATTTVHRMISDLTPILDIARNKSRHVILAGDLNISPQIPEPDRPHHKVVIDRIQAFGLIDCLGTKNNQYVRTIRHRNRVNSTPYQDDWIFASPKLSLLECYPVDTEESWSQSDHCPVVAEFEIPNSL